MEVILAQIENHQWEKVLHRLPLIRANRYRLEKIFYTVLNFSWRNSNPIVKDILQKLLDMGLSIENSHYYKKQWLFKAVERNSIAGVEFILNNLPKSFFEEHKLICGSLLSIAVSFGNDSILKMLLDAGIEINALFEPYGDFNHRDLGIKRGYSALVSVLCDCPSLSTAGYLISKGADIHWRSVYMNNTILMEYVLSNESSYNEREVEFIVSSGVDVNAVNDDGNTALHLAIRAGSSKAEVISHLINRGADPHIKNNEGYTAFTIPSKEDKKDIPIEKNCRYILKSLVPENKKL
jgi:hypothetical protein